MESESGTRHLASDLIKRGQLEIGDGYRAKNSEMASDGLPFVRVANVNNGIQTDNIDLLGWPSVKRAGTKVARPGDVVFTAKGTVGRHAFVTKSIPKFVYSPQLCYWRSLDPEFLVPRFLYYWIQSHEFTLQSSAVKGQTDMADYVSLTDMRRMRITVPDPSVQRRIAQVLGTLDDKIELNRRTNETLEAMAQAMFKSWFVDFDPVRAKAAGRQPEGMDADTAALFPDSFEKSELGEIPKGWKVSRIGNEFDIIMGQSPPGSTYNQTGEGIPFYQGRADFGFRFPKRRVFCTAPKRYAAPGDTLVSVRAPVGDINVAFEKCSIGRGVAAIRHISESRSFTIYSMEGLRTEFAAFEADGTVFGCIGKKDFHGLTCIAPPVSLVAAFERHCWSIDELVESTEVQSQALASTRSSLLPRLLSGELIPEYDDEENEVLA